MSKRLICLALCALMLTSVLFTSCKKEVELDTTETTATLTMLVISEEQVYYTDAEYAALTAEGKAHADAVKEQYDAVEAAINKITKAKYRTQLDLFYYTEEQYEEILEEKLTNIAIIAEEKATATKQYQRFQRAEKKNKNEDPVLVYEKFVAEYPDYAKYITPPAALEQGEEGDDAIVGGELKYPEVDPNQVDILFVNSYDMYMDYIEKGWLSKLDDPLKTGVAKKLTTYVYPAFLNAAKTAKGYYAVPNNTIVGEYTTLLVNKAVCDKYSDITQITSLYDVLPLIKDVAKYETNMDPVWSESYRGFTNVHFWSVDYDKNKEGDNEFTFAPDTFSVIGTAYTPEYAAYSSSPSYFAFGSILNEKTFRNQLIALKTLECENYYGAKDSEKDFAVAVVKGSGKDIEAYKDEYYTVTLECPVATEADLFGSMFAVSSYTSDLNRSMEILTLLNSDPDFRNLFQYGIQDVNYELNEEECAERLPNNLYSMDVYKTGNMFVAYPDADAKMNQQTLEYAKLQDREVKINPTIGFSISDEDLPNYANIDKVNAISKEYWAALEACKTVAELEATINDLVAQIEAGVYMKDIKQTALNPILDGDSNFSVAALYRSWAEKMGYAPQ